MWSTSTGGVAVVLRELLGEIADRVEHRPHERERVTVARRVRERPQGRLVGRQARRDSSRRESSHASGVAMRLLQWGRRAEMRGLMFSPCATFRKPLLAQAPAWTEARSTDGPASQAGPCLGRRADARSLQPLRAPLDDRDVRLPAALAHRLEAEPAAGPFELVEQRGHEATPVAPSGWPSAIAPPLTLTFARSAPVSRCHVAPPTRTPR